MASGAESLAKRPARAGLSRARKEGLDHRQLRAIGLTVVAAAVLTVLTIITFNYLPRYDLPGEPYITNADFRAGFAGWEIGGIVTLDEAEVGVATLQSHSSDDEVYLRREIVLPPGRTSLHLSADVAANQVRRGDEPWQSARIYLVQQAADSTPRWDRPHLLVELVGTVRRHHVEEVFEIPASVDRALLGIELPYATGQLEVGDLRLALLDELPLFRLAATLLVGAWCILAVWAGWQVLRSIKAAKVRTLILLTLAFGVAAAFVPEAARRHIIESLAAGFGLSMLGPDMLAHAALFAVLALLVRCGRPYDPLLLHLSCWLLAGAASEVLQLPVADQAPRLSEWVGDALGAGIGLLLAEVGLWVERRFKPKKRSDLARERVRAMIRPEP